MMPNDANAADTPTKAKKAVKRRDDSGDGAISPCPIVVTIDTVKQNDIVHSLEERHPVLAS
jgi:hypothetical protein